MSWGQAVSDHHLNFMMSSRGMLMDHTKPKDFRLESVVVGLYKLTNDIMHAPISKSLGQPT